jgi:hypothetical protein
MHIFTHSHILTIHLLHRYKNWKPTSVLIMRIAVGAVNKLQTLCSSITRKKAPESGVPTGFPCNIPQMDVTNILHMDITSRFD